MHTGYTGGQALELSLTERKIKNLMISCGFREPLTRTCEVVEDYPCVNELIRSIKGMGARNASDRRNKTPGVRKVWKKMVELYEKDFGVQDKIPATFEIIMGRGVKA
jgi:malonyl-CoA O-methyltransferase